VKATYGKAAATRLLASMRSFGVTGRVVGQQLWLTNRWTVSYTSGRTWPSITTQMRRVTGGRTALVFSTPGANDVMVMMTIEDFAALMGDLEKLMAETGRIGDAFTE